MNSWDETGSEDEALMAKLVDDVDDPTKTSNNDYSLECDRIFRSRWDSGHKYWHGYLVVSDFAKQHWCEQQMLYNLDPDIYLMRAQPGEQVSIEESKEVKEIKSKGTSIHLSKELEVQTPVEVKVETKEDKWAVNVLNLQSAVVSFLTGSTKAMEVPVFGTPFGCDQFVFGIIDELRFDPECHKVHISELKTRNSRYPPRESQQTKDRYQVSVYAQLFNELIQGKVTKEMMKEHLQLDLDRPLSSDVVKHIGQLASNDKHLGENINLSSLIDTMLNQIQALTIIAEVHIEYLHQDTEESLLQLSFELDQDMVQAEFIHHIQWWRGERGTKGVDIEDCWKCTFCRFSDLCEWREHMSKKLTKSAPNG